MSAFLLSGLVAAGICVFLYFSLAAAAKVAPVLGNAIEIILSAVGATGGVKVCVYVLFGQLAQALATAPKPNNLHFLVHVSEEDTVYFFIGGFALMWISLEGIVRRLLPLYRVSKHGSSET